MTVHPIFETILASHGAADWAAEEDRRAKLVRVEREASQIARAALLSIGNHLPEHQGSEMHAHFQSLASVLGYTVSKGAAS